MLAARKPPVHAQYRSAAPSGFASKASSRWLPVLLLSPLALACQVASASGNFLAAGTHLTNIAMGTILDAAGNPLSTIDSNPVDLIVSDVRALTLVSNQTQLGLIGGQVSFAHTLTNTGNVRDSYQLSLAQSASDQFDLNTVAVYADRDQNGIPDDTINLLVTGNTITLDPSQAFPVVVTGSIPQNRSNTNQSLITLTATSQLQSGLSATVTDTTTVTTGAILQVGKAENITSGPTGTVVTYTLSYQNTGNAAGDVQFSDVLDPNLVSYVAGSGKSSNSAIALTDTAGENAANSQLDYTYSGNTVTVRVNGIPAGSAGTVSFQVTMNGYTGTSTAYSVNQIPNTANFTQFSPGTSTSVNSGNTNTVLFTLQSAYGVILNNKSNSTSNTNPQNAAPDNLIQLPGVAGQRIVFTNYLWNTSNLSDNFNLQWVSSNLPSCASAQLADAQGIPLRDTSGDGIVDTGLIPASGSSAPFVVKLIVTTAADCTLSSAVDIDITARSVTDPGRSDPIRNRLTALTVLSGDLTNRSPVTGTGIGAYDNAGNPWKTLSAQPGTQVVFPLAITNTTPTTANNFLLFADKDGTLSGGNDLPNGWTVRFFTGDATCTTLGPEITQSGLVAAGATFNYCAVVNLPGSAAPSTIPLWFAMRSLINDQTDMVKDAITIGTLRQLKLESDQTGQVEPGGTVVYTHLLTNLGNVTEGTTAGSILLNVDTSGQQGMVTTVYYDANNNGVLDSTDPIVTPGSDLASLGNTPASGGSPGLDYGEALRLFIKVQAPTTLSSGITGLVQLIVNPATAVNGVSLSPLINRDTTVVAVGQLRLVKTQSIDQACDGTADNALSTSPVQVKPGQCVIYRLTATNEGATPVTQVAISDATPSYTTLAVPASGPTLPTVSQGTLAAGSISTNGAQGSIQGQIGTLNSGQSAYLQFAIRVQP